MRLEPLGSGVAVFVSTRHHFTTDTILLADFAAVKDYDRVVELGTGCGTIPLLLVREHMPKSVHAVDIQEDAIELLTRSIDYNAEQGHGSVHCITPMLGDIRRIRELLPAGKSDVVICNPPYKLKGAGITNPDGSKKTARHEVSCTLDDICDAAKWLLKYSGRFVMCQRPERLTDVLSSLREHDLEPKRLRFVQGRADKAPKLFLVDAKRGAKHGYMDVLPTLVVEDEEGFTPEMLKIYGTYKDGHHHG